MSQDSQSTVDVPPYLAQESADLYIRLDEDGLNSQLHQIQNENITETVAFESLGILAAFLTGSPQDLGIKFETTQITKNLDPIVCVTLKQATISPQLDLEEMRSVWKPRDSAELPKNQSIQSIYACLKKHESVVPQTLEQYETLWPSLKE